MHESLADQMARVVEPLLTIQGLTETDIESYDLNQLHDALERLNDAIAHPEQFGSLKVTAEAGVIMARTQAEGHFGALPILLARKRRVLERIAELRESSGILSLRQLVDQVRDDQFRQALVGQLDNLEQAAVIQQEARATAVAEEDASRAVEEQAKKERQRIENFQRRWMVWKDILGRESVASIVGAFFLVISGLALLIAMFVGVEVSAIVSNSFLVILGYFFGQGAERRAGSRRQDSLPE
ncbi:hypothetical protein N5079_31840 [Planotetraspora sp. A-T 1434]|uniref:hypothetical protein n=1 Tax=Planotetraspora sp. A-T 1434 TaxID=2979219 RepID=UPI0021C1D1F0|nr:hypothetical protein [Planotetraspora sp. A-T 1434]MCT9934808.1 hypothetical protein [Planotetraspora sp. A-T 1434]